MNVLIIGGDQISQISDMLKLVGVESIKHWDARKKASATKKRVPLDTNCVVLLTSFLNHNAMYKYKNEAKKRNIPVVCAKRSVACVYEEYTKVMGIDDCDFCVEKFIKDEEK